MAFTPAKGVLDEHGDVYGPDGDHLGGGSTLGLGRLDVLRADVSEEDARALTTCMETEDGAASEGC